MSTIYDDIVAAIFPELAYFAVGGDSFYVYRGNTKGIVTRQTNPVTAYVIPMKPDNPIAGIPQVLIWNKPWVTFAAIGTLIQSNDILVSVDDSSYVFGLLGRVTKFYGMLAAPTDETTLVT